MYNRLFAVSPYLINSATGSFTGLWRHLTPRSVLEFKGPTVTARLRDLDLLVEVGLGIDRRLHEEDFREKRQPLAPEEVSFWYIVKSLGRRFLPDARRHLGQLDAVSPGLWRSQILEHPVFLVSSEAYPTEADAVPLHLLIQRSVADERAMAELIAQQPHFWLWYSSALEGLHHAAWEAVKHMARTKGKGLPFDMTGFLEEMGVEKLVKIFGDVSVAKAIDLKQVVKEKGVDWLLAKLSPEQVEELKKRMK